MPNRPLLEPKIRLAANVEQAQQRITDSREDTLQAQLNKQLRERGLEIPQGVVTVELVDDEVLFDIGDNVASVRELETLEEEIVDAFDYVGMNVSKTDVVVRADIIKKLDLTGDL